MTRSERRLLSVLVACASVALTAINAVETLSVVGDANEYRERVAKASSTLLPLASSIASKERLVSSLRERAIDASADADAYSLGTTLTAVISETGASVKGYSLLEDRGKPAVEYSLLATPASFARLLSLVESASPSLEIASLVVKSMPDGLVSLSIRVTYAR